MRFSPSSLRRRQGMMTMDVLVALGLLIVAVLPLSLLYVGEQKLLRATCLHAVVMELVDGELELLQAGPYRSLPPGPSTYRVNLPAAQQLPAGRFEVRRNSGELSLAWIPQHRSQGGPVSRKVRVAP